VPRKNCQWDSPYQTTKKPCLSLNSQILFSKGVF
jgi:hypothetical protein